MTTTDPLAQFGTKQTNQQVQAPHRPEQVPNNEGGFVFAIDPISQFVRFLTIGTAGGTYYVGEDKLTEENGRLVLTLTRDEETQITAIDTLVEISLEGRALKQNPTLFALAIFCQHGTTKAKQHARRQITKVVRTGTHLFIFVGYLKQFGGWSRGLRKAVGAWYVEKSAEKLSYQLVKYRSRAGFTHRDVLRLSHPKIWLSPEMTELQAAVDAGELKVPPSELIEANLEVAKKRAAIDWAIKGEIPAEVDEIAPVMIRAHVHAMNPEKDVLKSLEYAPGLPWEALPDSAMNEVAVWDKMLDNGMPIGALLRQLPRLTTLGIISDLGGRTNEIVAALTNQEAIHQARIHPIQVLIAMKTYASGRGFRSENTWSPSAKIVDALDAMFYASFKNVEPANKRTLNALDISGSMGGWYWGNESNLPLTPREITAAMAMITVRTEPQHLTLGFSHDLIRLPISARQRLDDVVRSISGLPFGGTDCALPMMEAIKGNLEVDTFIIYTDNETHHGRIHPFQALEAYRQHSGINSRLVVVSITPTKFSIADPSDPGMLDISGFDAAVPNLISDFSAGKI